MQANYTGRIDIILSDSFLVITHQNALVGNVTINNVGTIVAQKSQFLDIPFSFIPDNPSPSVITSMIQEINTRGAAKLDFKGYVNAKYILYPFQAPLQFSKDFQRT